MQGEGAKLKLKKCYTAIRGKRGELSLTRMTSDGQGTAILALVLVPPCATVSNSKKPDFRLSQAK